jgi:hypothetical protein
MSGREALKGFGFQTDVMLLCFLEHCIQETDFYMIGEPAKNIDTGDIVDIALFIKGNSAESRKVIQVKKCINANTAKDVVNELLQDHWIKGDHVELWFAEYVLQNKMDLFDAYDKLIEAINTPGFAKTEIKKKLGNIEILICIDSNIPEYSFDGVTLKLKDIEVLDGIQKSRIEDELAQVCGLNKQFIISNIKTCLNETLVFRRHKFLDILATDASLRQEVEKKDYDYFKKIIIRQIHEEELLLKIKELIPSQFTTNQREILQDVLFASFLRKATKGQKIEKSDVNALIIGVGNEFGHKIKIIDWSNRSLQGAFAPNLIPTGDFSMGGGAQ